MKHTAREVLSRQIPFGSRTRSALLATITGLAFLTSACVAHVRPVPPRGATVVKVRGGHVHSKRCAHFRDGDRWYLARGHVHQRGCGHVVRRGVWVVRR
ncbi:MAG: hypothetical protein AAF690_07005 [Acidobacteriota bacterium]